MVRILMYSLAFLMLTPTLANARQILVVGIPCVTVPNCELPEVEAFLSELYSRAGLSEKTKYLPMLRDITAADSLITDASFSRTPIAVRDFPNLVPVPFPITKYSLAAITAREEVQIHSWKDLRQYRVGILRGNRTPLLLAEKNAVDITLLNNLNSGIAMLVAGRLDVIIENPVLLSKMIPPSEFAKLTASKPIYTGFTYHYLNKKHASLAPQLARTLREMLKDGTTQEILAKWSQLLPSPAEVE